MARVEEDDALLVRGRWILTSPMTSQNRLQVGRHHELRGILLELGVAPEQGSKERSHSDSTPLVEVMQEE